MKNGKYISLFLSVILFSTYIIYKKNNLKNNPSKIQYKKRLEEFCLHDIENAKKEFDEFLSLGMNNDEAFELTIARRVYL